MNEIKITQTNKGFFVEQGNKQAEMLSWDEMLGTIAALTMPNPNLCLQWMKEKEKTYTPKDGDFVTYVYKEETYVAICKDGVNRYYVSLRIKGSWNAEPHYNLQFLKGYIERRLATDEEKQLLLDALHKDGKDWDAEKKEIMEYKWPRMYNSYAFVTSCGDIRFTIYQNTPDDQERVKIGNCFHNKEEAKPYAKKFKVLLGGKS